MPAIGIDFGGSRLRVAAASPGASGASGNFSLLRHSYASERMPFLAAWEPAEAKSAPRRFQIDSLKRLLDFDSSVSVPPSGAAPLDLLVEILERIRGECAGIAPQEPLRCVLTVPPCFSERQRSALRRAAVTAGLTRVKLVDDTLAAIMANKGLLPGHQNLLVFSWGASTFSTILYQLRTGTLAAVAQEGNRRLGGDDLDAALCDHIWESLARTARPSPDGDSALLSRIAIEAEAAKRTLAEGRAAVIPLSHLLGANTTAKSGPPVTLPEAVLDSASSPMTAQALEMLDRTLSAPNGAKPDLVLTLGGMARLPVVKRALEERLGRPVTALTEDSVAIGAAMHAAALPEDQWPKADRPLHAKPEPVGEHLPKRPPELQKRAAPRSRPAAAEQPFRRAAGAAVIPPRTGRKVKPNEPCPCKSGRKYKMCCGIGK